MVLIDYPTLKTEVFERFFKTVLSVYCTQNNVSLEVHQRTSEPHAACAKQCKNLGFL